LDDTSDPQLKDILSDNRISSFGSEVPQTKSNHACHILSFEVMDQIFALTNSEANLEVAQGIVNSMNKDDNLIPKDPSGNMFDPDGKGDRALDEEIIAALETGGMLSKAASARARRQIQLILNSKGQFPILLIRAAREKYTALLDDEGHKICRKNVLIKKVDPNKSRLSHKQGLRSTETQQATKTMSQPICPKLPPHPACRVADRNRIEEQRPSIPPKQCKATRSSCSSDSHIAHIPCATSHSTSPRSSLLQFRLLLRLFPHLIWLSQW
jgi:hypothetical protein